MNDRFAAGIRAMGWTIDFVERPRPSWKAAGAQDILLACPDGTAVLPPREPWGDLAPASDSPREPDRFPGVRAAPGAG